MILYYAFDREMLNSIDFNHLDKDIQSRLEKRIENELKMLIFFMPLDERVVISPSFRFESEICRRILSRNRAFLNESIIVEYRRESDERDFWEKKKENYRKAMDLSEEYRNAYENKSTYYEVTSTWIDRIPKNERIGRISRDVFMLHLLNKGKELNIPENQIKDVLKITAETREDTFLWEIEDNMLQKHGFDSSIIRDLGIRDAMNASYLNVFEEQGIYICKTTLGLVNYNSINSTYDMWKIQQVFHGLDVFNYISFLPDYDVIAIRNNVEIQKMLDVIRNDISQNVNISGIINHVTELYDFKSVLNKISHKTDWSEKMLTEKINGKSIKILHLSDLHFTDEESMNKHLFYLKIDLKKSLKIRKVDYLIITGDVCDKPVELMYKAAASFVIQLTEEFKIPKEHVILTIGNHDCDREMSKKARPEDKIIDQEMYNKRFIKYNDFFYEPIKGKAFSMEPTEQFEEYISIEDKICFLSLNSCWLIDHIDTTKSAICIETIQNSKLIWLDEDEYLKLAMWHHPISGEASIQDAVFMDTLATTGFKACFHGHIHEAKSELFNYDDSHSIKMIGAGTFGAVQKERGDGIPRQYNLVEYNKSEKELIIHTRKREKDDGVWQADARWGEKDLNPKAFYKIKI